ncbi:MAG: hypothetical protein K0R38_2646 [Polyangiaceae bacterium]|jgi:hypothetical protein|nr:hypothetical protein [Polyangiaceae bacterium]
MLPRKAEAAEPPPRLLIFNTPNGCYRPAMSSSGTGASYTLAPSLRPLAYADLLEDVTLLSGLDNVPSVPGGDVHSPHVQLLTGGPFTGPRVVPFASAGQSWDQAISARLSASAGIPPAIVVSAKQKEVSDSDLTVRGQPSLVQHYLSWTSATTYVRALRDPSRIYEVLFGISPGSEDEVTARATLARKRTLIDAALPQIDALRHRVGARDRATLDAYLSSLREVERRLARPASSCGNDFILPEVSNLPERLQLLADLAVLAFQCDATRLIVLTTDYETTSAPYPWVGVPEGWIEDDVAVSPRRASTLRKLLDSTPYHLGLSHHGNDPDKVAAIRLIDEWHVAKFAALANQLKAAADGSSSLLDSSLLLFTPSIADGASHSPYDLPCVLAGRGGGAVTPGQHRRLATGTAPFFDPGAPDQSYQGTPFSNLLVTLSDVLGSPEPSGTFGNSTGRVQLR